ncbi:MAG: threonine ammonia-lyase [Bacillota bacterium]
MKRYTDGVTTFGLSDVFAARTHLAGVIHATPLRCSRGISALLGRDVYFKFENLQRTGSFKIRGAYHKLCGDVAEGRSVVAASAGNHAQGVALAASLCGKPATVVMPKNAPRSKIKATLGYGARVILSGNNYHEAYQVARRVCAEKGAVFIHAFDDPRIIAGQGTVGLEILEVLPDVDTVVVPVGGGGLIAGISYVVKELKPSVKVVGVIATHAPSLLLSVERGVPVEVPVKATIADGIAVDRPGDLPFQFIRRYVDEVVAVDEEAVGRAILLLLTRTKTLAEGAGAVGLAAFLENKVAGPGKKACIVLSGGNIDPPVLARVATGRKTALRGKEIRERHRTFEQDSTHSS